MENKELQKALIRFANQDLGIARKDGHVAITQTKIGNVEIVYNRPTKRYFMNGLNGEGRLTDGMTKAQAVEKLVSIYDVVTQ